MFKQSSSGRNPRTKGFKVKHVLQACVLVAVCVWVSYQVKHSHDKKKVLEEGIIKISTVVDSTNHGLFRFGRKDLPHVADTKAKIETHGDDNGNEYAEEAEKETKSDEHVEEHLDREDEDETDANGEDGIGENDQEEERDNGEELSEEEDDEEEETKRHESEEHNGGKTSNMGRNYESNTQDARERNYKGDDVSSAVVRSFESTVSEGGSHEQMFNVEKDSAVQTGATETDDGDDDHEFEIHQYSNGTMNATSKAEMEHEVESLQMNSTTEESSNSTVGDLSNNSVAVVELEVDNSSIDHNQNLTTTGMEILREPTDKKPNTTEAEGGTIDGSFKDRTVTEEEKKKDIDHAYLSTSPETLTEIEERRYSRRTSGVV